MTWPKDQRNIDLTPKIAKGKLKGIESLIEFPMIEKTPQPYPWKKSIWIDQVNLPRKLKLINLRNKTIAENQRKIESIKMSSYFHKWNFSMPDAYEVELGVMASPKYRKINYNRLRKAL